MSASPATDEREPRRRPRLLEAFVQDFNLIALGGAAALAAVTASPIPLIVGGAAEALYLINAPGSRWFERYLGIQRARHRQQRREAWRRRILLDLPRSERERFRTTQRRLAMAEEGLDAETRLVAQAEMERVQDLLDQLLDLLNLRVTAARYLSGIDRGALMEEMRRVLRRLQESRNDDMLTRVEHQRQAVLEKRLAEHAEMTRNLEIINSQISTLEHSIAYLADKLVSWSAAGREPTGLTEILAGVESTEQALEQVRPVMERIQRVREA